jgi:hypothetical protein
VSDLATASVVDLAAVDLDYEGFRALARNPHLSANEKIGFPDTYRDGFEDAIWSDILGKLPRLVQGEGLTVVDIGPGCAGLPRRLVQLCRQRGHTLVLVDSPEMLDLLPDVDGVTRKCAGLFPANLDQVLAEAGPADAVLCYSVLHYIYVDSNLFDFVDALMALLAPGGRALVGDIPNASKRRRFFASQAGQAFHRAFTGSDQPMPVRFNEPVRGKIDDAVLLGVMARAQAGGCDAWLTPQGEALPMANRRDDLIIGKP